MMLDGKQARSDALSFDVATVALRGMRPYQEDSLISSFPMGQTTGFAVLSDGMGGHAAGHVASALVVAEIFTQLKLKEQLIEDGVLNIPATLEEAAEATNARVAAYIADHDEAANMGATLLSVVIRRDKLYWISVGDSPLLLYRDGALRQLNKDHSMAPEIDMMVKVGALTEEAGKAHPGRSTLTSAILGDKIEKMDCPSRPVVLLPDDILIAASDGLQFLSNTTIAKCLMASKDAHSVDIADSLMTAIEELADPDQDNAAFIVIKTGIGQAQDEAAVDLADLPVLATADDAEEATTPAETVVASETTDDAPDERKAYWYRGQKYYRD